MRMERSWARRFFVIVLVAAVHIGIILLLIRGLGSDPRRQSMEDISMSMILFPLTNPRATERVSVARHPRHHQAALLAPSAIPEKADSSIPPAPSSAQPGKSIDWDLEMQRAADSVLQAPKTRAFGEFPKSEIEGPRPSPAAHYAGESYRDVFGDTYVWTSASCYVVSPAPELGVPTAFAHTTLTRVGCIRQGPPAGELFKDLPEYKKSHPQ
jgi:hypothetical protein